MTKNQGFSLIETMVYLFILSILIVVLIYALVVMIGVFTASRVERNLSQSAVSALGRVVQELRRANSATVISANQLSLNTTDWSGGAAVTTVQLSVQNDALMIQSGAGAATSLTLGHTQVSSLTFTKIVTTHSEAVKIALSLTDNRGQDPPVINFQTTVVLRGSY